MDIIYRDILRKEGFSRISTYEYVTEEGDLRIEVTLPSKGDTQAYITHSLGGTLLKQQHKEIHLSWRTAPFLTTYRFRRAVSLKVFKRELNVTLTRAGIEDTLIDHGYVGEVDRAKTSYTHTYTSQANPDDTLIVTFILRKGNHNKVELKIDGPYKDRKEIQKLLRSNANRALETRGTLIAELNTLAKLIN